MEPFVYGSIALVQICFLYVLYRYMTEKCPSCERNSSKWGADVLQRIHEWEALLAVAQDITGWPHHKIVSFVIRKLEETPL